MSTIVVTDLQYGDTGKGKITDFLARQAHMVIRFQGGANSGHTIRLGETTHKLHLVPSGIFYPCVINVLGNGTVIDLPALVSEINILRSNGISINNDNLLISECAHLVMPYHKMLDEIAEAKLKNKIGTTKKGIGPAYTDKISRTGIRMIDLHNPDKFKEKLSKHIRDISLSFQDYDMSQLYDISKFDNHLNIHLLFSEYMDAFKQIESMVIDTVPFINRHIDQSNKLIVFEGAQGTYLDIDHGSYPFVTSSSCCAGGACTGAGVGPTKINKVLGITKAYTTRVGSGPFVTELFDNEAKQLVERGNEYGTTTGRMRRVGWLDLVMLKRAVQISGVTKLAITKLDVLDSFETINVCHRYFLDDHIIDWTNDTEEMSRVKPIYSGFRGWQCDTSKMRKFNDLPQNAQNYLRYIEDEVGVPIEIVSVGPERDETIKVRQSGSFTVQNIFPEMMSTTPPKPTRSFVSDK